MDILRLQPYSLSTSLVYDNQSINTEYTQYIISMDILRLQRKVTLHVHNVLDLERTWTQSLPRTSRCITTEKLYVFCPE